MTRPSNPILIALCAVSVTVVLVLGVVFFRFGFIQKYVSEALSRATGLTVRFESVQPSVFSSTRMHNVTATDNDGNSLFAKEGKVRLKVVPLLTGKFVFRDVTLNGVRYVRVEKGRGEKQGQPASVQPIPQGEPKHVSDGLRLNSGQSKMLGSLRSLKLLNVTLDWQLADGRTKLQMEGADLRVNLEPTGSGDGEFMFNGCTWMEMLRVTDGKANFKMATGTLRAESIEAVCGGGKITGTAAASLGAPQSFSLELNAAEVDLDRMTADLPSLRLAGKAEGQVRLGGDLARDASWTGDARMHVTDGKFKGLSLFQMLGQLLQIQELSQLQVKEAVMNARIADRKIQWEEFQLNGGDIRLSALGSIDFERNLALNTTLKLQEKMLSGRVSQILGRSFTAPDSDGLRSVAFQVGGTIDKPSTNLMEKVVGDGLGGVLNQVLGGFLKPRKTEAKEAPPEQK